MFSCAQGYSIFSCLIETLDMFLDLSTFFWFYGYDLMDLDYVISQTYKSKSKQCNLGMILEVTL